MKILAQVSSWLEKMVSNAKEASPAFAASWLERFDPTLFPQVEYGVP